MDRSNGDLGLALAAFALLSFLSAFGDVRGSVPQVSSNLQCVAVAHCDETAGDLPQSRTGLVSKFAPHERIAFLGDSITHGGHFIGYLQLFAALRHPGWDVRLFNVGVSGDDAACGAKRWDWDLKSHAPDRTFVMFGMNDVGRYSYRAPEPASKAEADARAKDLADYRRDMGAIADLFAKDGMRGVLLTPSPFDQYSDMECENLAGCNEVALMAAADIVRRLARERGLGLVEIHAPFTRLLKEHPEMHLCGSDRVHARELGHLLMAALILESMGETDLVASVTVRAKRPDGAEFAYAPRALPFPRLPEYEKVDGALFPLTERFNREMLTVTGLAPGRYDLCFDGECVGTFAADELARGVNVALLDTPNQRLAQETAKLMRQKVENDRRRRHLVLQYVEFRKDGISADDFAAQDAQIERRLNKMKAAKSRWYGAHVDMANRYRQDRVHAAQFDADEKDLLERINAVRPKSAKVTVRRTGK